MKLRHPLKEILRRSSPDWDTNDFRPEVRHAFRRALECGTAALGAEIYASETQTRVVPHTCKSRACPSCGHRSTIQWQREKWVALPEQLYKGVTFTMPRELWNIFRDNRKLCSALSSLAANALQVFAGVKGLRIGVIAIPHTFNGRLEFNCHVHVMATGGAVDASSGTWKPRVYYATNEVTYLWRCGVIGLLRAALRAGKLHSNKPGGEIESLLDTQEQRWWSVKIQAFSCKRQYLAYAARYVRRPPIAQRRITKIGQNSVRYWTKDKRSGDRVDLECSLEEFVKRWEQHIPNRYQHAVRSFGLFSSRFGRDNSERIFILLGQRRRPRPRSRRWSESILRDFNLDPLLDATGVRMKWVGRMVPQPLP